MRYALTLLSVLLGSYMLFDGLHALVTGEYVTVAGRLGPWAAILAIEHIDPHGRFIELGFLALGVGWLVHSAFVFRDARSRVATTILCVLTLWYVPFGTLMAVFELCVVWFSRRKAVA